MAIKRLPSGKYEVKYPNHRDQKGKIVYRSKTVHYKKTADEIHRKLFDAFKEREASGIPHPVNEEEIKEFSVSELLDWFLDLDNIKTLGSYKDVVGRTRPLKDFFGNELARNLEIADIMKYRNWRKKQKARRNQNEAETTVSNGAVNREVAILKQCFNHAMYHRRETRVEYNPCKGIKPLKEQERDRVLSREEYEALENELSKISENARDVVVIGYHLGMRYSEIVNLTWDRVDFKNCCVRLRAEDTKTKEPRKVPILSQEARDVFERRGGNPRRIHGEVFGIKSIRTTFAKACKRAGIEGFHFHDLRHTCATNLRKAGIDTATVMKILGHKSVAMYIKYNKVDDEDLKMASEAMARGEEKLLTPASVST